jgi:hypothetical protein
MSELTLIIILIPLYATGLAEFAVYFVAPFTIFIVVLFYITQHKLARALTQFSRHNTNGRDEKIRNYYILQVKRVRWTSVITILAIVFTLAVSFSWSLLMLRGNGWQVYSDPSHVVGPLQVLSFLIPLGLVSVSLTVLAYAIGSFTIEKPNTSGVGAELTRLQQANESIYSAHDRSDHRDSISSMSSYNVDDDERSHTASPEISSKNSHLAIA